MNRDQLINRMKELYVAALKTARKKNDDYAGDGDAFKNLRGCERHGVSLGQGILVRMEDKLARIGNLLRKPASVADESIIDTAMDLANYVTILAVWYEAEVKKSERTPLTYRGDDLNGSGLCDRPSGTIISFPDPGYNGNT